MDRDWLEEQLAAGRSLGDIAREIGRNPSTVSYWTRKFGLRSRYVRVYASRGGIQEKDLSALVDRGLSIRQIAAECGLSPTTIRHWLRRFGLRTRRASRVVRGEPVRECPTHGPTTFRRFGGSGSFRCPRCASARVARRRRQAKEILVEEAGGACALCGYSRYVGALQFHHLDPATKRIQFAERGLTRALEFLRQEAKKCVLLCANCHAEVEAGIVADTFPE
jgi:DNA-binding CsgD family transcriptional regulator